MARSDPRVKSIINHHLPSRVRIRNSMFPCSVHPDVRHIPIVSFGATNRDTLGKIFMVCTSPTQARCGQHMKPTDLQMSEADLALVRRKVAELDPPAKLGGTWYIGQDDPVATAPDTPRGRGRPQLEMTVVDCYVYIQDGEMPISIPLLATVRSKHLEVRFRQAITCDILNFGPRDTKIDFEPFSPQLGDFDQYPRAQDKRFVPHDQVLVYRARGVLDCPGAADLAVGKPIPSFLQYMRTRGGESDSFGTPANSPIRGSAFMCSMDVDSSCSSPARYLRSGRNVSPSFGSPASASSSRRLARFDADVISSGGHTSKGTKRKRAEEHLTARKRAKGNNRLDDRPVVGRWERIDDEIEMWIELV
ncbi:uncharacterized protein B0H18DRAFT_1117462 [Fomitopsis serialis]|uniref:uncharacterized protein n=1 Tax=Fomitopsis serialis TaxID=139415 RepID=UPI00200799E3|nr:uncharacterized protein B0H18DRAFT_1117462 [Neoantrodia serialis]KAH9929429.1 hypothetical protein B0H18DRAFT_1117462 [Neoantrodia serialis]